MITGTMICTICNKQFNYQLRNDRERKVCSRFCRSINNKLNCKGSSKGLTNCFLCKKEFTYIVNKNKKRLYCSRTCKDLHSRTRIEISCIACGKIISRTPSGMHLSCSLKCRDTIRSKNDPLAFYKNATDDQKLNKLKELYNNHIIKKDGCWDWSAAKDKHGYGILSFNKRTMLAHRASWIIHNGEIPKGLWVLHHCDNASCSRPSHLYIGNAKDNRRDCVSRGRTNSPKKEKHPQAKLNRFQVLEIRKLLKEKKLLHKEIAEKFNISKAIVSSIKNNKTWKD